VLVRRLRVGARPTDSVVYLNLDADNKLDRALARLRVNKDGTLPDALAMPTGRLVADDATLLQLPPLSYGFVVLPAANAPACSGVVAARVPPALATAGVTGSPAHPPAEQKRDLVRVSIGVVVAAAVAGSVLVWARTQAIYARPHDDGRKLLAQNSESPRYGGLL